MKRARLIAFYLPQFYPTPENDKWWGKGFTEWTNVGRAKPLFCGHYQPKIPADLGYYDLRLKEVRIQQAQLASEAGIEGFCYWHYWFNGRRMLDRVFSEVQSSGEPNFPFCLCWANHSWYAKTWDPKKPPTLLIEQTYPGIEDYVNHFYAMLPSFKDQRYIKVNGKLLFGFFAPLDCPSLELFKTTWNNLAKQNNLPGFTFFGYTPRPKNTKQIIQTLDYAVVDPFAESITSKNNFILRCYKSFNRHILHNPYIGQYKNYKNYLLNHLSQEKNILPCVLPNYDHTPRSGRKGLLLHNATPQLFGELLQKVLIKRQNIPLEENLIFIKAWNEWGEGNYLEPDLKYGKGYLEQIRKAVLY